MDNILRIKQVEEKIIIIGGEKVLLDSDVATLYEVETREINQAVKNNPRKFPEGYIIQLQKEEWVNLKSKILTSSWGGKNKIPNAFTEKGLYMLATILKGDTAIETTLAIVETFAKIRELSRTVGELAKVPDEEKQKTLMQKGGEIMSDLIDNDLNVTDTETSFEINLAVMKFKHTIKRGKDKGL
jgi:phage regulator Rha-like protein